MCECGFGGSCLKYCDVDIKLNIYFLRKIQVPVACRDVSVSHVRLENLSSFIASVRWGERPLQHR